MILLSPVFHLCLIMHRWVKVSVCLTYFTVIGALKEKLTGTGKQKLTGTGPFIIRFQGVTSTQDYKNILVYSSVEDLVE